jgi:hypothetical protein
MIQSMPVVPHPACTEPPGDTVICRFMDFDKFRDLFGNEELYLRRTDRFKETDPQEGLPSDQYVRKARGLQQYDLHDELALNNDQAFTRQTSEGHYINCWQIFEGETLAMWNTYGKGVVTFSQFHMLKSALDIQLDPIFLGVVRYGEKEMMGYNTVQFLFTKRRHFEKERELRVVLQCYDPMAGANRHYGPDNFPNREPLDDINPLHAWVHDSKRRRIDLKSLVTEIRLSPWATPGEFNEVGWWVKNKNLSCPITHSECEGSLTPTPEELKKYGF